MLQCVLVPCLFIFFVKAYLEKAKLKSHGILLVSEENHVHKAQSKSSICLADLTFLNLTYSGFYGITRNESRLHLERRMCLTGVFKTLMA